jgi:hypothetical protein
MSIGWLGEGIDYDSQDKVNYYEYIYIWIYIHIYIYAYIHTYIHIVSPRITIMIFVKINNHIWVDSLTISGCLSLSGKHEKDTHQNEE